MASDTEVQSERESSQLDLTVEIVAAYVSNNHVQAAELATLIGNVYAALGSLGQAVPDVEPAPEKPTTAQIRKSITPDALISFVDGKPYKTLKRHLARHRMDLAAYRARYGLPADYPSTAPNYSAQRSALAKSLGLGQYGGRPAASAEPEAAAVAEEAPKRRGRPKQAAE